MSVTNHAVSVQLNDEAAYEVIPGKASACLRSDNNSCNHRCYTLSHTHTHTHTHALHTHTEKATITVDHSNTREVTVGAPNSATTFSCANTGYPATSTV